MKNIINLTIAFIAVGAALCSECPAKVDPIGEDLPALIKGVGRGAEGDWMQSVFEALEEQPYNYALYVALAFIYDREGRYEDELWAMQQAVAYMPEDLDGREVHYGNLGRAYMLNGRWEEGMDWIRRADEIDPGVFHNRWNAYDYYLQYKKDNRAAAAELVKVDRLAEDDYDAYYTAFEKMVEGRLDFSAGVGVFEEAVLLDPGNAKAHRALGTAVRMRSINDGYEAAMPAVLAHFHKALELDPDYIPTYISIGHVYMLQQAFAGSEDGYAKAIEWFDKAAAIDPGNEKLALSYGLIYIYMRENDKAIAKLKPVWDAGYDDGSVRYHLAVAYNNKAYEYYLADEHFEEGLALIEEAIALIPEDGVFLSTKAELLYKLGRYEEAYELIQRAAELEPGQEEIKEDLAMIEEALGK